MSQFPKVESQWNKVFHERPTENSEESFFYQFIRKTTEKDLLFTARKMPSSPSPLHPITIPLSFP